MPHMTKDQSRKRKWSSGRNGGNEQENVENKEEGIHEWRSGERRRGRGGRILRCSGGGSRRKTTEVGSEGSSIPITPNTKKANRSEVSSIAGGRNLKRKRERAKIEIRGEEKGNGESKMKLGFGPYADWAYEEGLAENHSRDPVRVYRKCSSSISSSSSSSISSRGSDDTRAVEGTGTQKE